jgi:hypothetical protein
MDEKDELTVRDKRSGAPETGETQQASKPSSPGQRRTVSESRQDPEMTQDLDFSTFVISLASSTQVNLGAMAHPETNQIVQNFPAAKQMVDILAMLKTKTKGNLTEAEAALLEQVLFSLHLHYARAVENQKKSGG